MSTIYIAMIDDRHSNTEPYPFTTADAAIAYARAEAHRLCHDDDEDGPNEEPIDGWLYYACYSTEGDSVWVVAKELDAAE